MKYQTKKCSKEFLLKISRKMYTKSPIAISLKSLTLRNLQTPNSHLKNASYIQNLDKRILEKSLKNLENMFKSSEVRIIYACCTNFRMTVKIYETSNLSQILNVILYLVYWNKIARAWSILVKMTDFLLFLSWLLLNFKHSFA